VADIVPFLIEKFKNKLQIFGKDSHMSLSDEEQLDSLKSFAKKYGSAMISGILIALIAFFGWEYWQKKTLQQSDETAKVQQLMDEAKQSRSIQML
jgi:predicted negative regulator of RcsB-dependent stress response